MPTTPQPDYDDEDLPPIHVEPTETNWHNLYGPREGLVGWPSVNLVSRYGYSQLYTRPNAQQGERILGDIGATSPYYEWSGEPDPADLAGAAGLPSGNSAVWSILQAIPELRARWEQRQTDYVANYGEPSIEYQMRFANLDRAEAYFRTLSQCPCADCFIEVEYPACECGDPHCEDCYPDGPPDWCECEDCYVEPHDHETSHDDLDDDDDPDFTGLPEVVAPDGRVRFGIEIEFAKEPDAYDGDLRNQIVRQLARSGLPVADLGYTHEVTRCWKMTTDATVTGGELVSPIMSGSDESIEQVREALRVVKAQGGVTDRQCGMHVHLDVTRFRTSQLKALVINMRRAERMLAAYVPDHRHDGSLGHGAELYSDDDWDEIEAWVEDIDPAEHCRTRENRIESCPVMRYKSINFNSLLTYGTVEVRLLGHTLNTVKVRTWIRALQTIVDASSRRALISGDGLEWLSAHGLEPEHAERFRTLATRRGKADWLTIAA